MSSKDNPADYASRGYNIETFLDSATWLNGPDFLSQKETEWPEEPGDIRQIPSDDPEIENDISVSCLSISKSATSNLIEHFSSWKKRQSGWLVAKT